MGGDGESAEQIKKASRRREAARKCQYKYSKNKTIEEFIEETEERQFIIATVVSVISLILGCGALLFEILY